MAKLFVTSLMLLLIGMYKEARYRIFSPMRFEPLEHVTGSTAITTGQPPGDSACIVYVPGTWSKASLPCPQIAAFLADSFPSRSVMVFRWNSRNSAIGRDDAAKILADTLSSHSVLAQVKHIYLVGHSHGGSVCAAAAAIADDRRCKVITLGTPFIEALPEDTINLGRVAAFFGTLIWPLLLVALPLGGGIETAINEPIPAVVRTMTGLLLIALLIRAFFRVKVSLDNGSKNPYARCTNIVADGDTLIQTMEGISAFCERRALLLEKLAATNSGRPRPLRSAPPVWLSASIWFGGFVALVRLSDSWLAVFPFLIVAIWFYSFPNRLIWRVGHFALMFLLMANPVAVALTLSNAVTFGGNVLQVSLGRARVSRSPGKSSCVGVALTDVTFSKRTFNAHSAMLESARVRSELLQHLGS